MTTARYNPTLARWTWGPTFREAWVSMSAVKDSGWRTIHGAHVKLGDDGRIAIGPKALVGTHPSEHGHDGKPDGTHVRPNTTTVTGDNFTHTTHDGRKVKGYIDGGDWVAYDVDGQHPGKEQDELSRAAKAADRVEAEPGKATEKNPAPRNDPAKPATPAKAKATAAPKAKPAPRNGSVPVVDRDPADLSYTEHEQNDESIASVEKRFPRTADMPPVVLDDRDGEPHIIDGHHRAIVAEQRGDKVPTVTLPAGVYDRLKSLEYDVNEIGAYGIYLGTGSKKLAGEALAKYGESTASDFANFKIKRIQEDLKKAGARKPAA